MLTFLLFVCSVAVYIVFLAWCLAPLVRRPRRRWLGWLRVILGLLLLAANLTPIFALPVLLPAYAFAPQAERWLLALILFPRTLPIYVQNVIARASATATVIDVTYPIAIAGTRYAPVVRTACTTRTMIDIDYGAIQWFDEFPTASGGELVAQDAGVTLALDQSPQLCSLLRSRRLQPGPLAWPSLPPRVYVIRGEADKTQIYQLYYYTGAFDDIALQPAEIARVEQAPASDVVALDALWPIRRPGESGYDVIAVIEAYRRLPAGINACVELVHGSMDSQTKTPKVSRSRSTHYPDYIPDALRPIYCRVHLWWSIPRTATSPLSPVRG